tara:strand:+ start:224 stop:442 length:219 start_codon:yes stop_codon:yes gene_type:complete
VVLDTPQKESDNMPVKRVKSGWKVVSYVTGKTLKRTYKSKKAAENAAATSKRRSQRKRSTGSRRARKMRKGY